MQPVTGLSYEQGPPLGVPLGFFQSAALFLLLAAVAGTLASLWPGAMASRWSPATLAITHLLTLGFLGLIMLGALLQMLPVLLGVTVHLHTRWIHASRHSLGVGTLLLSMGLFLGHSTLMASGAALLGFGFLLIVPGYTRALASSQSRPLLIWPYRKAWLALLITLSLGIALAGGLAGLWPLTDPIGLTHLHMSWGLAGWVLLLVIGSAYQVIPMLQLTPPYPARISQGLTWILFAGLALGTLGGTPITTLAASLLIALATLGFALSTLWIQHRRRRKVVDETMKFWRLGMVSLALCALSLPVASQLPDPAQTSLGILFLIGFATPVVIGMLYKILPFLAWFHLRTQTGAPSSQIPNMKQFIPDQQQRRHFWLQLIAVILLVPTPFLPGTFALPGWGLLALSALQLLRQIRAVKASFLAHNGRL